MANSETERFETYLNTVREIPELAPDDARQLAWLSWSGDRAARQELIEHHLWMVVELAERLHPGEPGAFATLLIEGNRALVQAAETFRPWHDGDFPAYAMERLLLDMGKEALPAA